MITQLPFDDIGLHALGVCSSGALFEKIRLFMNISPQDVVKFA